MVKENKQFIYSEFSVIFDSSFYWKSYFLCIFDEIRYFLEKITTPRYAKFWYAALNCYALGTRSRFWIPA